jgi:hypothetical protein
MKNAHRRQVDEIALFDMAGEHGDDAGALDPAISKGQIASYLIRSPNISEKRCVPPSMIASRP